MRSSTIPTRASRHPPRTPWDGSATGSGVDRVVELLAHEEPEVRFRAVEALGRLKAKSAVPLIAPLTLDSDRWVAIKAAETLGRIGSKKGASGARGASRTRRTIT